MATACDLFLNRIDAQIQAKHLLKHEFYQAWSRGDLSIECLKEYAKDYYHHVKAFPGYISELLCRVEDAMARGVLLQNFIEEIGGSPNHPELWKNFTLSLGVTEQELAGHQPSKEIQTLIATFRGVCSKGTIAEGVAALYAYESQIPEICISKIDGLKQHYGFRNPKDWEYFAVHIAADKEHAVQERTLLANVLDKGNHMQVSSSVDNILDVLQNFLTGLCHRFHIACACS